ncbi:MAG: type I 3-dehydroquinate dehydratase [Candidatus Altiarchaeota archaeon]|nr:type I 3-dehydroquinate dehydratase [Candidatus Altiarchaeota archaeon]
MALICVPLVEKTVEEDVALANSLDCDLVEVRLDYLKNASGVEKLAGIKKPVIATCMPAWEGGLFGGSEEERVSLLESCLPYCRYVSVELKTDEDLRQNLIKKAKKRNVKVIVAFHDFKSTPSFEDIVETLDDEERVGADIVKVAFMANDHADVLTLLRALVERKKSVPVIALSIGEKGKMSRILAPVFGSYLTFASASKDKVSAPGQMALDEMKKFMTLCDENRKS